MKRRKLLTIMLCVLFVLVILPSAGWASVEQDPLALPTTPTATMNVTVDDTDLSVTNYKVIYVADPVPVARDEFATYDYQTMNIYVPSNVTENSPIMLQVKNSGWMPSAVNDNTITDGASYDSTSSNTGAALKAGYVVVSAGTRSRGLIDINGAYVGHAPAVVVDTKAAIRYLRYNDAAMPGSAEHIIITGTSGGGGGLSVAVAASGNSPDYYPCLYDIGAAGIFYNEQSGTYSSTINDDVFATVAYCPITDLDHACAAYEWMYRTTRMKIGTYSSEEMDASDLLAADYIPYFNGLGLKDEYGNLLTADKLDEAIKAMVEKELEEAYVEVGPSQMAADISALAYQDSDWYLIDANGKATLELDKYLYFVAMNKELKNPSAFDNYKTPLEARMNESNLYGTTEQEYSNFTFWGWNNNNAAGDGIGYDDTGLEWDEYIQTDAGKALLHQAKMINPMPYLVSATEGDSAPYWYVRHGIIDRDTSFAVEVALYYAILNDSDVSNVNFELPWLQGHGGNYDVPEAYEWVAEIVDIAGTFDAVDALIDDKVTDSFSLPAGAGISYSSSNESVFKVVDGQAVVTRPAPNTSDASVTLTVNVASDKTASDEYNYGQSQETRTYSFVVPANDQDLEIEGVTVSYGVVNGTAQIQPSAEQFEEILNNSGNEIVIDMNDWESVDVYLEAGWFKSVDKKITIITSNGSFTVKTKTLWNNSDKTRLISVSDRLKIMNI